MSEPKKPKKHCHTCGWVNEWGGCDEPEESPTDEATHAWIDEHWKDDAVVSPDAPDCPSWKTESDEAPCPPQTLPADIAGLTRPSSRVRSRLVPGCVGLVLRVRDDGEADVCWLGKADGTGDEVEHGVPLVTLALDLADPTGRAHAAWWLLRQGGNGGEAGALVTLRKYGDRTHLKVVGVSGVVLATSWEDAMSWHVPGLADCDLVPEALRRVVLHVAGRGTT
jgi:hypothetical protein